MESWNIHQGHLKVTSALGFQCIFKISTNWYCDHVNEVIFPDSDIIAILGGPGEEFEHRYEVFLDEDITDGSTGQLNFLLRGPHDGSVLLAYEQLSVQNGGGYEIVIGGWVNTMSAIRKCIECDIEVELYHR